MEVLGGCRWGNLSLPAVIRAMLGSEGSWVAASFFCEVFSRKEEAERVRQGFPPPPSTKLGAGSLSSQTCDASKVHSALAGAARGNPSGFPNPPPLAGNDGGRGQLAVPLPSLHKEE
jgi:hypothetical protein